MRNKAKGFPNRISLSDDPDERDEYASQRPNGTIKDRPQERMFRSHQTKYRHEEHD